VGIKLSVLDILYIMTTVSEYIIDVRMSDDHVWSAKVNAKLFSEPSEEALRESIRIYLLGIVSAEKGIDESALSAKLKRTWRVRVVQETESSSSDDDANANVFDGFSLFD